MAKWRRNWSTKIRWARNHLIKKQSGKCFNCKKSMTMKEITLDHILPLSKGGSSDILNLQLACYQCNQLKADMTEEEFLEFQSGKTFN